MADMGLGAGVIYEKVALPRGEIDLILKVTQLRRLAKENVGAGITASASPGERESRPLWENSAY